MTDELFDRLFTVMLIKATENYKKTSEGILLKEKIDDIYEQSKYMFNNSELLFAMECFDIIAKVKSSERKYIYFQGFKDCMSFLKYTEY